MARTAWAAASTGSSARAPRCLAAAGRLLDDGSLAAHLGLSPATPLPDLLATAVARLGAPATAARVRGTLSWAVWEPARRRLWVCRDRLGHQGVVHARRGGRVAVGVEAGPVLAAAGHGSAGDADVAPQLAPDLLAAFDHLHGRFPRAGRTYHQHLESLPPGHLFLASPRGVEVAPYWRLEAGPVLGEGEMVDAVAETLERVVADHLGGGLAAPGWPGGGSPLLSLSGGLDTPSLAAVARGLDPERPLDAFTWTFPGMPEADEEGAAVAVAAKLGLRHHLMPSAHRVTWGDEEDLAPAFDSPFCHYYEGLWRHTLRWARQRGFASLVTGTGGDHLFGFGGIGAYAYPDLLLTGRWLTLGRQLALHAQGSHASPARILDLDLLRPLAHLALGSLTSAVRSLAARRGVPWLGPEGRRLLGEAGHGGLAGAGAAAEDGRLLPGRRHRLAMLRHGGVDAFLVEMGRRGSRWGVELRHPYLDARLFELAARLPGTAFHRAGLYKPVLRDAMAGRLPPAVLAQRRKASSSALFHRGMRRRRRREVEDLLHDMRAADLGLVEPAPLKAAWEGYRAGGRDTRFWHALTLEAWLRCHGGRGGGS